MTRIQRADLRAALARMRLYDARCEAQAAQHNANVLRRRKRGRK